MMKFDQHSKISDLLANKEASAVLDNYIPGFSANPMTGMAGGFTLGQLAGFPQANISPEQLEMIVSGLSTIE